MIKTGLGLLGLIAALSLWGCSGGDVGPSSSSGGTAGSGAGGTAGSGAGGTAGSGAGIGGNAGSDAGPPPAQAGLLLRMRSASPAIPGKACNVTALTKTVPDRDPTLVEGPTNTVPGVRVIDGEDGSRISCTVQGSGSFSVAASIEYGSTSFTILGGTVAAGSSGTAQVSVYTPDTSPALTSPASTPCTFIVTGGGLQIQSGSMWAEFDCPTLETSPSTACSASGVVILENCTE